MLDQDKLARIATIKQEVKLLLDEATKLADETKTRIGFYDMPWTKARGSGGSQYYGVGNEGRYDGEGSYVTPEDYGGWRSSATDYC
jgi:hypothetical protein